MCIQEIQRCIYRSRDLFAAHRGQDLVQVLKIVSCPPYADLISSCARRLHTCCPEAKQFQLSKRMKRRWRKRWRRMWCGQFSSAIWWNWKYKHGKAKKTSSACVHDVCTMSNFMNFKTHIRNEVIRTYIIYMYMKTPRDMYTRNTNIEHMPQNEVEIGLRCLLLLQCWLASFLYTL